MITWLLQAGDLLVLDTGVVRVFLIFGAACWSVWLVRLLGCLPYSAAETGSPPEGGVSVLVPTFEEEIDVLEANVANMLACTREEDEVLVLFDERDTGRERFSLDHPRLRLCVAPPGKRQALRVGIEQATKPFFLLTGSDTRIDARTIPEILKPFANSRVGGVTGRVEVERVPGIGARCYRWSIVLRNRMLYPAMSCAGTVHVLNGECYAARTELARARLDAFTNQRFLGRRFDSGDDGWMTTLLLRDGYRTEYQSTAVAQTRPPSTLREYMRQQLRWNRNSTRRTLTAIRERWSYQRGFLYPFHLWVTLLKTPLWIGVALWAAWLVLAGGAPPLVSAAALEPWWSDQRLLLFAVGVVLVRAVRGLPYLVEEPDALLFLPLYAFLCPFVLAPMRLYAMLTARNASWITRGGAKPRTAAAVLPATAFVAGLCLLALFAPVVAVALAMVDPEMDAYG